MAKPRKADAAAAPVADIVAMVPLADLYVHTLNARSEPPAADIEALADSIAELGLLQNLAGFSDPETPDAIGVVAGGRRLRALIRLSERDSRRLSETRVPVRLTDSEETARLWASAENSAREALHPADEVRAYGRMAATGADPDRIAKAFAVTVRHVRQRLRLAQLPDPALNALRAGEITLDQAGALTSARDDDALLAELSKVQGQAGNTYWGGADAIRNRLANASVSLSDRRAAFIGLEYYRLEGGRVQEDLFSSAIRLLDEDIVQRLFEEKLTNCAAAEMASGWKWVEVCLDEWAGYKLSEKMERISRVPMDLPQADRDEMETLSDKSEEGELTSVELDRFEELEHRAAGEYRDEDIATSGLWLYVDRHGELSRHGPFRRPEDDPNREEVSGEADEVTVAKSESAALSNAVVEDLKRIRLAALQLAVSHDPSLTWDLMAWQMSAVLKPYAPALGLSITRQTIVPEKIEGFEPPASLTDDDKASYTDQVSPDLEAFRIWRNRSEVEKGRIVALATARAIIDGPTYLPLLAQLTRPDVRRIWTPTAAGFFSRLPVARLDAIWLELMPDTLEPNHAKFRAEKKGEKAQLLHKLFNSADFREAIGTSREFNEAIDTWLPPELQWPAVDPEIAQEAAE